MDAVEAAFADVPRARFLPALARRRASYDGPIQIGHGQTNSQPRTVENMLRLLAVRPGDRVLDVGSGSGWTTALLARLAGPDCEVLGVELVPALVKLGARNLARHGAPGARIEASRPGVLGAPDHAPYDRILVSAAARELPDELVDQLAPGGRLVLPVQGRMLLVVRGAGEPTITAHGEYRFVPLRT